MVVVVGVGEVEAAGGRHMEWAGAHQLPAVPALNLGTRRRDGGVAAEEHHVDGTGGESDPDQVEPGRVVDVERRADRGGDEVVLTPVLYRRRHVVRHQPEPPVPPPHRGADAHATTCRFCPFG